MNGIVDDGLIIPEVGAWSEEKYKHILLYSGMFLRSIKGKWNKLVYIDLFSGAGMVKIENTSRIIESVPLKILSLSDKFDQYIFCDIDTEKTEALKQRIKTRGYNNTSVIACDANEAILTIKNLIPKPSAKRRTLHYCLLDIYGLNNLKFATVRTLSELFVDFFVLIPSFMDANRNSARYLKQEDNTITEFLGHEKWRDAWVSQEGKVKFGDFIVAQFGEQMTSLGYLPSEPALVRSDDKNLPLYHLALYSRDKLGAKLWKQTRKYANPQTSFLE